MEVIRNKYEAMMEEIHINKPLSDENAKKIIRKYDKSYRRIAKKKNKSLSSFEQFINMNHPLLNYHY